MVAPPGCSVHRGHFPGCFMASQSWAKHLQLVSGAQRHDLSDSVKVWRSFSDAKKNKTGRCSACCGGNFAKIIPWRGGEESRAVPERGLRAAGPVPPLLQALLPAALWMITTKTITYQEGGCNLERFFSRLAATKYLQVTLVHFELLCWLRAQTDWGDGALTTRQNTHH